MEGSTVRRSITLVVLIAVLAASFAFADDELQPKIEIPKVRHDFGKVFEQDKYSYEFTVRNRGKADLVISKVEPG